MKVGDVEQLTHLLRGRHRGGPSSISTIRHCVRRRRGEGIWYDFDLDLDIHKNICTVIRY
jgi:hypothetical protein